MNVRVCAAMILLAAITVFCISISLYIEAFCGDMLEMSGAAAVSMNKEKLSEAAEAWQAKADILSCIIPHDHIDRITESFLKASAYLELGCLEEYSAEMQSVKAWLTVLKGYDVPTLRSVF